MTSGCSSLIWVTSGCSSLILGDFRILVFNLGDLRMVVFNFEYPRQKSADFGQKSNIFFHISCYHLWVKPFRELKSGVRFVLSVQEHPESADFWQNQLILAKNQIFFFIYPDIIFGLNLSASSNLVSEFFYLVRNTQNL